jgi:hypothetical protein
MPKTKDGYTIHPCEHGFVSYKDLTKLCRKQLKEIKRLNKLIDELKKTKNNLQNL